MDRVASLAARIGFEGVTDASVLFEGRQRGELLAQAARRLVGEKAWAALQQGAESSERNLSAERSDGWSEARVAQIALSYVGFPEAQDAVEGVGTIQERTEYLRKLLEFVDLSCSFETKSARDAQEIASEALLSAAAQLQSSLQSKSTDIFPRDVIAATNAFRQGRTEDVTLPACDRLVKNLEAATEIANSLSADPTCAVADPSFESKWQEAETILEQNLRSFSDAASAFSDTFTQNLDDWLWTVPKPQTSGLGPASTRLHTHLQELQQAVQSIRVVRDCHMSLSKDQNDSHALLTSLTDQSRAAMESLKHETSTIKNMLLL